MTILLLVLAKTSFSASPAPVPSASPSPVPLVIHGLSSEKTPLKWKTWTWTCSKSPCRYRWVIDQNPTTSLSSRAYGPTRISPERATVSGRNGEYYLHVQAKSGSQESEVVHVSAVFDNLPPKLTGLANRMVPEKELSWSWGCNEPGCRYRYLIDQLPYTPTIGSWTDDTTTTFKGQGGVFTLHIQAIDPAGNLSQIGHYTARMAYPPEAAPLVVTKIEDSPNPVRSKTWTWNCSRPPCQFRFLLDRIATTSPASRPWGLSAKADMQYTQPTGDGSYYLHVQARDALDNESPVVHSVAWVDGTRPLVTGLTNSASPQSKIEWRWGCNKPQCTYRFLVDSWPTSVPTGPYGSITSLEKTGPGGRHYLHVQARDSAGNESFTQHFFRTIAHPPGTSGLEVIGLTSSSVPETRHQWNWSCSRPPCGYRYKVDRNPDSTLQGWNYGPLSSLPMSFFAGGGEGVFYIHVQAIDSGKIESPVRHASAVLGSASTSGKPTVAAGAEPEKRLPRDCPDEFERMSYRDFAP